MKQHTVFLLIFFTFALACLNVPAQSPDKILKKAVKSLGGENVLRGLSSKEIRGRITRLSDGANGGYQSQTLKPNLYMETYDISGLETSYGYNGKSGWMRDTPNGLRTLIGDAAKNFQVEANYRNNLWLNYKDTKSKIAAGGQATINGSSADAVLLTSVKGVVTKIYFDKNLGLPLREEFPQVGLIFDYADYRMVDGIQEPFSIVSVINNERYEIKLDSVTHNSTIAKTTFDFPKTSNEPLPEISSLLKQIQINSDKMDTVRENYTYTQTEITREFKDGILREKESQTFQVSFYKGSEIHRLVAKNEIALTADEQAKQDKKAQEAVEDIDKNLAKKKAEADKKAASGKPAEPTEDFSIAELLRASTLSNPRREHYRGRDVIVFDFEPNPTFDYKNAKSILKLFGKTAGVMYIDETDKEVVRVEAVLADSFKIGGGLLANLKKGSSFTLENTRVNNEVWLPSLADINVSVKVFLVKGININQIVKYGNYEKFNSEVKDSKINEVKKP